MSAPLTAEELRRYARQLILSELGPEGQAKLKAARVLIVGAGGLGSPLALYLAAAGVGHLGLIDFDFVDITNLHRQILHSVRSVGKLKVESAEATLGALNPQVKVETYPVRLDRTNALDIARAYDLVADGTDNFATRYLTNDACVLTGIPNVHGSVYQFEGQVTVYAAEDGPCYRCLYPRPPPPGLVPSCADSGVLGVLPGLMGTLQATEVLKLILSIGKPLIGRMALYHALDAEWQELAVRRDPDCPICGDAPEITTLIDYEDFCGIPPTITASEFRLKYSDAYLLDVRQPHEAERASMGAHQLIPVEELSSRLLEIQASFGERIVVHCQTGARSARATSFLRSAGYRHAVSLEGGIVAWQAG